MRRWGQDLVWHIPYKKGGKGAKGDWRGFFKANDMKVGKKYHFNFPGWLGVVNPNRQEKVPSVVRFSEQLGSRARPPASQFG
jgi:hypothetical protein